MRKLLYVHIEVWIRGWVNILFFCNFVNFSLKFVKNVSIGFLKSERGRTDGNLGMTEEK